MATVDVVDPVREPRSVSATRHPQRHVTVLAGLGGIRLRYIDVGPRPDTAAETGELPLLLLHGLASRIEEYENLIAGLGARRRIIAFDLPGNGYSDKPDRPYSLELMEDAALALLDHLRIDRANLAGGSLGGNLTLRLAKRQPERFERLAAWAPAGAWEPQHIWPRLLRPLRWLPGSLMFWPMLRLQSRFWYHPAWEGKRQALATAFAHFREVYCRGFVRMYFDLGYEQVTTSLFPIAPRIAQPTLLLWGDQDHGLNMGVGIKRLRGMLPDARLVVFPNARHSLAAEIPGKLAASLDAFFGPALVPARVPGV